jgi:hypothetical protein
MIVTPSISHNHLHQKRRGNSHKRRGNLARDILRLAQKHLARALARGREDQRWDSCWVRSWNGDWHRLEGRASAWKWTVAAGMQGKARGHFAVGVGWEGGYVGGCLVC